MNIAQINVNGVIATAKDLIPIPAGLIGATVTFKFEDDVWKSLTKTVCFRGAVPRDVVGAEDIVTIPCEVLAEPGRRIAVGVYGTNADKQVVIPTLWAELGFTEYAADPSGDPSTDPALPVWAQLQEEVAEAQAIAKGRAKGYVFDTVEDLELWLSDEAHTTELAVGDNFYIRALDVPDYWWDGTQKQPLETQKVELSGYVKSQELDAAVTEALEEAKESGDFNGYSPYTYLRSPDASEPTVLYGLPSGLYVFDGYFKKNANSAVERITPDVLWTVNSINAETWMCGISCAASVFAYRIRIDTVRLFNFDLFNSITVSNIHERVISSLTGKVSAMTTADQKAACKWLGTLNVIENPDGSLTVVFPSGKTKHIDLSKIEIFL